MSLEAEFSFFEAMAKMDRHLQRATGEDMTAELMQAIAALRAMMDGAKTLKGYADEVEDTYKRGEFMRIIGELSVQAANANLALSQQISENEDLGRKVKALEAEVEALKHPSVEMKRKGKLYYKLDGAGPYCPQCWESDGKLNLVSELENLFSCSICQFGGTKRRRR